MGDRGGGEAGRTVATATPWRALFRGAAGGSDLPADAFRALGDVFGPQGEHAGRGGLWSLRGRRSDRADRDRSRPGLKLFEYRAVLGVAGELDLRAVLKFDRDPYERSHDPHG